MNSAELAQAGRLEDSLAALQAEIRNKPQDDRQRIFLFQLDCVLGRLDKALTQLQVIDSLTAESMLLAQIFRPVIACELLRSKAQPAIPALIPLLEDQDATVREQVVAALEAKGHPVLLFAPTAGAAEVLRKEGFPQSQTVQHLLMNPALQADLRGKVLVVDEAGLLSTRQMVRLLELRRSAEARLILCGDTREHAGVEAGDALRLLEGHSALQVSELGEIRRQTEEEYRKAIAEIAAGHPGRAFVRLDRMGAVEAIETEERYSRLAADYVTAVEAGDSALIVAPTWSEIERVNAEVRERLKETGHLDRRESIVETHRSLQWTEAQRRDYRNYEPGQVLTTLDEEFLYDVLIFHSAQRPGTRPCGMPVLSPNVNHRLLYIGGRRGFCRAFVGGERVAGCEIGLRTDGRATWPSS